MKSDAAVEQQARNAMKQGAYVMDAAERAVVCTAIVDLAAERDWTLLAVHVRTSHVHMVVQAEREPERIMSDMKARASRELTRAGFDDASRRRWTRHGSTRHLFREEHVAAAVRYTLDEQGARMAYYDPREEPRTQ